MGEQKCLNCGRKINGPVITTPNGDNYHYGCVNVDYPEDCGTESRLNFFDEQESPLYDFFEFLDENPYESQITLNNEAPEKYLRTKNQNTLSLFGYDLVSWKNHGSTDNINPVLLQAVEFGRAMERDYPAFADEDELYPHGSARVPPEEEELPRSGD